VRHNQVYASPRLSGALGSDQPFDLEQVSDADEGSPFPEDDFWVQRSEVRPLPGHGAHDGLVHPKQDALAVRGAPLADTHELPSPQRVERVRYPDKKRPKSGMGCILG
jgi:hypothetical protein